jgi:putative FmdB family regulatory protein
MPAYDYKCVKCDEVKEITHGISETPDPVCELCGGKLERQITSNFGGFLIKGGSSSIHWKEKNLRRKMNEEAGDRMQKKYGGTGPKIQPNIAGVPQDSWSDCQKLAKESGLNAASYQPMVDKEKKNKIQVATS